MLSKNKLKYLKSLSTSKFRDKYNEFIAEGTKLVLDLLESGLVAKEIYATEEWIKKNKNVVYNIILTTKETLKNISNLKNPQDVLAVFEKQENQIDSNTLKDDLTLVLDQIQDPGNLGTIIRTADWFGIKNVICIKGTVDLYNPKVIQATMGAIARVKIASMDTNDFSQLVKKLGIPVYGAFMEGDPINKTVLAKHAFIVMGNEGNGISSELQKVISSKIAIESYPKGQASSESLNVAIAASIICYEFRKI